MWIHTHCPYGTEKQFCPPSSQITPPLRLYFNSFFTSFVKFDVFSVAPPPSQDELDAAVLLQSVVLLWQTIISETPEQRELLFTTICPLPLNQSTLPITH